MFDIDSSPAASEELEDLPLERVEHELTQLASHIYAGTARWLQLVAEFDRRQGWGSWGCRSWRGVDLVALRRGPRAAREHVRVARALAELPGIRAAFSSGRLSYSKVRALTRVADPDSEQELLGLARFATAAQLERLLRAYRRIGAREAGASHEGEYFAWSWEQDGSLSVRGRLCAEDGALLLRALDAARDALWREQQGEENGSPADGGSAGPPSSHDVSRNGHGPRAGSAGPPSSSSSPPSLPSPSSLPPPSSAPRYHQRRGAGRDGRRVPDRWVGDALRR